MRAIRATLSLAVVLALVAVLAGSANAQERRRSTKTPKPAGTSKESYTIVQVGDDYQVVSKSQMADLRKKIDEEYKEEMKRYQDEVKEARKNNQKLDLPRPVKPRVKVIKSGFKDMQDAEEHLRKLRGDDTKGPGGGPGPGGF